MKWSEQRFANRILAKHVYISKLSVSSSSSTSVPNDEIIIIRGLTGPQSQIELKKGASLKIEGKDNSIKSIASDKIGFTNKPLFNTMKGFVEDIILGLVQYKLGRQWHKLQPKYELINPSEWALEMKKYDDTNPKDGFPKKHEIMHCTSSLH